MKKLISLIIVLLFVSLHIQAQESKVVEAEFKVEGVCGMCKTRIEKAVKIKEVKFAKWDKTTKILKVAYITPKITVDSLMQRIAAIGHDTDKFKADDAVYAKLPKCCLYRDNPTTH
jgi:hypothetical protein